MLTHLHVSSRSTPSTVVAVCPQVLVPSLRAALGRNARLVVVDDSRALEGTCRARDASAILYDIAFARDDVFDSLLDDCLAAPTPVIWLSDSSRVAQRRLLVAARRGLGGVVLYNSDSMPESLQIALMAPQCESLVAGLLRALAGRIDLLPYELGRAIVGTFADPTMYPHVLALEGASGMSRRGVDRWLGRAGLATGVAITDAARLSLVWTQIVYGSLRAADVVESAGYRSHDQFARHTKRVIGLPPSRLTRLDSRERVIQALVAWCVRTGLDSRV